MRMPQKPSLRIIVACCLAAFLAGCGTAEYERRMNANLSSLGANRGGGAVVAGVSAGYQTIEDYPQYEMQIPDDYAAPTIIEEAPNFRIQWKGEQRDNGSAPQLQVKILEPPAGASAPGVDQALEEHKQMLATRFDAFSATPAESVSVGGFDFRRIAWSGTDITNSLPVEGISYATVDGTLAIHIDWYDSFDDAGETRDAAYAAAESFRRSP